MAYSDRWQRESGAGMHVSRHLSLMFGGCPPDALCVGRLQASFFEWLLGFFGADFARPSFLSFLAPRLLCLY